MKNKKSFILLMMILFLTTGCVREKLDVTIHKDKSMDFSMDMGVSKTFMETYKQQEGTTGGGDLEIFDMSDAEIAEMKKKGINIEKYDDGSYTGMKAFLKITNIDIISSTKEVEGDLESIIGVTDSSSNVKEETTEKFLFTVKKGFFKNTYTAKLKSSMSDEVKDMTDLYTDTDATINNGNNTTTGNGTNNITGGNSSMDDFDFSTLASGMDMGFTVNLPYKAISNNAKTVDNNGKTLSWNLLDTKGTIEFSFALYNMKNVYLLGGGLVIAILLLIIGVVFFMKKRRNKNLSEDKTSIDRGMKESYPAVTNMIGPNPTPSNPSTQNQRVQAVPVTTKPVLQPNPIAPTPQPIQAVGQSVPVQNAKDIGVRPQNIPPTISQPVSPQIGGASNRNQQPVQNAPIQGQMSYNQNMVGAPTMNQQVANGMQSMSIPATQPVNSMPTMNPDMRINNGVIPPNSTMVTNTQNRQVPTNNQMNRPMQGGETPMNQTQPGSNPTDIFGQNNSFQ